MLKVLYNGVESKELFIASMATDASKNAYFASTKETAKKYNVLLNKIYWNYEYWRIKQQKNQAKEAKKLKENAKELQFVVDYADYLAEQNQVLVNAEKLAFVANHAAYIEQEKAAKATAEKLSVATNYGKILVEEIARNQAKLKENAIVSNNIENADRAAKAVKAEVEDQEKKKQEQKTERKTKKIALPRVQKSNYKKKKRTMIVKDDHIMFV